jgi:hypothetical protein
MHLLEATLLLLWQYPVNSLHWRFNRNDIDQRDQNFWRLRRLKECAALFFLDEENESKTGRYNF